LRRGNVVHLLGRSDWRRRRVSVSWWVVAQSGGGSAAKRDRRPGERTHATPGGATAALLAMIAGGEAVGEAVTLGNNLCPPRRRPRLLPPRAYPDHRL